MLCLSLLFCPLLFSHSSESFEEPEDMRSETTTWMLGFLFVTIISMSGMIGLFFVPQKQQKECKNTAPNNNQTFASSGKSLAVSCLHNGLEGLAMGSLLASSIFHLIPHAFDLVGQGMFASSPHVFVFERKNSEKENWTNCVSSEYETTIELALFVLPFILPCLSVSAANVSFFAREI